MPIYTRSGDDGTTGLLFGGRVSKADLRCEAYGMTDQAVSALGLARALSNDQRVKEIVLEIQRDMFTLGAELATLTENMNQFEKYFKAISAEKIDQLEAYIDELNEEVQLPPKFIIPGASAASGALDLARTALRTAERRMVELDSRESIPNTQLLKYVNRLADLLFMLGRYEDRDLPMDIVTGTRLSD